MFGLLSYERNRLLGYFSYLYCIAPLKIQLHQSMLAIENEPASTPPHDVYRVPCIGTRGSLVFLSVELWMFEDVLWFYVIIAVRSCL